MKPAFSTVACPQWTLDEVALNAERLGYLGVELRTFGSNSTQFACDPALTDYTKTRSLFDKAGVDIACLATSLRYDEPVADPFLHILGDKDKTTRATKSAITLAGNIECPLVRVYAFEMFGSETRAKALRRIVGRLKLAAAAARNTGVRLVLENGGSFPTAADLAEILDGVASPHLAASYSVGAAWLAGEDPSLGVNALGDRLQIVKLIDYRGSHPCALGRGDVPNQSAVKALRTLGFMGWTVFEYPVAWVHGEGDAFAVLEESAKTLYSWMGGSVESRTRASMATSQAR